jgi:uncharacterized membrane protein YeiB
MIRRITRETPNRRFTVYLSDLFETKVESIRRPRSMQFILHIPWWGAALATFVGIALWVSANRRQDKTLMRVSLAIVGVSLLLGVLGFLFPTDQQKMERRTKQMVKAVDKQDWNTLGSLLDDETALSRSSQPITAGRDQVVGMIRSAYARYGVKSVWTMSTQSIQTQTLITVTIEVVSTQDMTSGQPVTSSWQLDYEQFGDGWTLQKITLIHVGGDTGDSFDPFGH